jgi:hypothetical protein
MASFQYFHFLRRGLLKMDPAKKFGANKKTVIVITKLIRVQADQMSW